MSSQRAEPSGLREEFPEPAASNVTHQPTLAELRELARADETTTEFGSPAYVSTQKSRSADRTKNLVDHEFEDGDWAAIERGLEAAGDRELLCLDRRVGRHPDTSFVCRLFVPRAFARIALAWGKLLEPADGEPDFLTIQLPDWEDRLIRVLPEAGCTLVLGSDYTGEAKKSFLRLFMYRAKQRGGLGIHAGTKRLRVEREGSGGGDGDLDTVGQAFLGLSATGKSTLTGHGCGLDAPEGAELLQDDVCALLPDGTVAGSEGAGLYIKTHGLDREEQPALYDAATHESAVFENVAVKDGRVDFEDGSLTTNGRAVVRREHLRGAGTDIDLDRVDQLFFITRNPLMAPVARLTDRQAAVAFMLGESIQTSAGDPDAAGESVRVVGTNPFIVGPEGEEGNRFYELLREIGIETYLINTGGVGRGDRRRDIGVRESVCILVAAARGAIEWTDDDRLGLEIPETVPDLAVDELYPPDRVPDFDAELADLRAERRAYLAEFETLADGIREAVY
jgi:phosphoenolpyruvate carboxykinase (ATP)